MPRGRPKGEKRVRLHAMVLEEVAEEIDLEVEQQKFNARIASLKSKKNFRTTRGKVIDARFKK